LEQLYRRRSSYYHPFRAKWISQYTIVEHSFCEELVVFVRGFNTVLPDTSFLKLGSRMNESLATAAVVVSKSKFISFANAS